MGICVSRKSRPITSEKRSNLNSAQPTMTEILWKLLRQQVAPEVDVKFFIVTC